MSENETKVAHIFGPASAAEQYRGSVGKMQTLLREFCDARQAVAAQPSRQNIEWLEDIRERVVECARMVIGFLEGETP
jgi:hypothetical protein